MGVLPFSHHLGIQHLLGDGSWFLLGPLVGLGRLLAFNAADADGQLIRDDVFFHHIAAEVGIKPGQPFLLRDMVGILPFAHHLGLGVHLPPDVQIVTGRAQLIVPQLLLRQWLGVGNSPPRLERLARHLLAARIQEQLDTTLGQYSLGLENLSKEAEEQKNIQAKIASRKQEIQQLRTYQRGLYEGLIQNHLSKDEYFTFKEKYEAKIEAISKEIEQLKAGLAIIAKQLEQYKMLSQDAQHIKEDRQLTAALIDRLIDRVEVSREKRITVRFRFQSEFEHCEEVLSQCRNM